MFRVLFIVVLCLQPVAGLARCEGTDLIAAMPEDERRALTRKAQAAPYAEGLLWHATRGDTRITLFGTYHFQHDRTNAHLDRLKPLIALADTVYLEVSNDDQAAMQRALAETPSLMFIIEGPTLPDLLGEADWQRLAEEMRARSIPAFFAAKFKPVWAAMMLGIGPCEARNGAMQGAGIDKLIGEHAAQLGTPSRSLEDFRTVLKMLDTVPMEKQLDMIRLFFAWPDNPDDMAYTLRQRYLTQQIALIWQYSRQVSLSYGGDTAKHDFERFERLLLTERNAAWIDVLMDTPEPHAFVAVGAAHLPGETGLLRLLEQRGFAIKRLPF